MGSKQDAERKAAYVEEYIPRLKGKLFELQSSRAYLYDYVYNGRNFPLEIILFTRFNAMDIALDTIERVSSLRDKEIVLATGKVVKERLARKDLYFIYALEALTTKGVGYVLREHLCPLQNNKKV